MATTRAGAAQPTKSFGNSLNGNPGERISHFAFRYGLCFIFTRINHGSCLLNFMGFDKSIIFILYLDFVLQNRTCRIDYGCPTLLFSAWRLSRWV